MPPPLVYSIREQHNTNCDGNFEVTISLSHDGPETVKIRVSHPLGGDKDVQNIQFDQNRLAVAHNQTVEIIVTGNLKERCKHGEFIFEWVETVNGQDVGPTRDQVLIAVSGVPFVADDTPDPVTAKPSGEFHYLVDISCCGGGVPVQLNINYNTFAAENTTNLRSDPSSPIPLGCPGGSEAVAIYGILLDPTLPGIAKVKVSGRGRCFVVTKINPNRNPDHKAHHQALQEWHSNAQVDQM